MQESIFRTLRAASLLGVLPMFLLVSCNDIFEEDLTDDIVTLTLPANSTITTTQATTFLWSEVAGATSYDLEVVTPSFFGLTSYTYDTTISSNSITLTMYPGTYQWRVRAENFGSSTSYSSMFDLVIDTTSDLSVQTVTLAGPVNSATNSTTVDFNWTTMSAATSYQLQLYSGATFGSGTLIMDSVVTANALNGYTISEDEYSWGVKAINLLPSETSYSSAYFEVDRVSPNAVTLTDPDASIIASDSTFNYTWVSQADTGDYQSALTDSIYIATDSLFTNIFKVIGTNTGGQSDLIPIPSVYYWRIKTYDAATNESGYSDFKSFEIQ